MFNVSCIHNTPQNATRVKSSIELAQVMKSLESFHDFSYIGWLFCFFLGKMEMDTHFSHHPTLSQPHAELIKRSLTGSDISKYNKSWPHVTSSISEWKKSSGRSSLFACYQRDARRSNCSSSLCFHSHATVPHIVALPGFSFHAAKIRLSAQTTK